jgi:glycosyltransferase involved in cell wall biosynthesis
MGKIKIFLGGYINKTNAQNLNCLALSKYLNKEKFDIYTLSIYSGNMEIAKREGVDVFHCYYPHRIVKYIAYLWGIWNCDIAYLPKGENWKWNKFLLWLFCKKSISTVESIIDDIAMKSLIRRYGNMKNVQAYFKGFDRLYSITGFMAKYNFERWGIKTEEDLLYLGSDIETFINKQKSISYLNEVVLVGNDLVRKGFDEYVTLANIFPDLTFHIVGTGNGKIDVVRELGNRELSNVIFHGGMQPEQLVRLLQKIDLHILPSRLEGFPKVILETAAAGIPSLLYSDYGAHEWISDRENGFIVNTFDEMQNVIQELLENTKLLQHVSKNSLQLAQKFDWKSRVKEWEKQIETLYYVKIG